MTAKNNSKYAVRHGILVETRITRQPACRQVRNISITYFVPYGTIRAAAGRISTNIVSLPGLSHFQLNQTSVAKRTTNNHNLITLL